MILVALCKFDSVPVWLAAAVWLRVDKTLAEAAAEGESVGEPAKLAEDTLLPELCGLKEDASDPDGERVPVLTGGLTEDVGETDTLGTIVAETVEEAVGEAAGVALALMMEGRRSTPPPQL